MPHFSKAYGQYIDEIPWYKLTEDQMIYYKVVRDWLIDPILDIGLMYPRLHLHTRKGENYDAFLLAHHLYGQDPVIIHLQAKTINNYIYFADGTTDTVKADVEALADFIYTSKKFNDPKRFIRPNPDIKPLQRLHNNWFHYMREIEKHCIGVSLKRMVVDYAKTNGLNEDFVRYTY